MKSRRILGFWNDFWFFPRSPLPISIYRILVGLVGLSWAVFYLRRGELLFWYGQQGVLSVATAVRIAPQPYKFILSALPLGDGWIVGYFVLFIIAAFMLTIGLFTRFSAAVVWFGYIFFYHRNPVLTNAGDRILRDLSFFLIFSRAGDAVSLDRLWRIARGKEGMVLSESAPWAQRLIQMQIWIVYFWTAYWKLQGTTWIEGTAVYWATRLADFWSVRVPFFLECMWTLKLFTWFTLALELLLGTLVWVVDFRYFILAAGVVFHAGIFLMFNIPIFSVVMISSYATFIEPEHLSLAMGKIRSRTVHWLGESAEVIFQGGCSACLRIRCLLQVLDLWHKLSFVEVAAYSEPSDRGIRIRLKTGEELKGFEGFRWLSWKLPLLWPVAILLLLPPFSFLVKLTYNWCSKHKAFWLGIPQSCGQ